MKPMNFSQQVTTRHTLKVKYFTLFTAIAYSLAIVFFSLINLDRVLKVEINASDKTLHTVSYGLLFLIWSLYFYIKQKHISLRLNFILAWVLVAFGIIIEAIQGLYTSYRTFDWWDAFANTLGVTIAFIICVVLKKLFN
jgi:glycopeptide antibiotics resistance protein